MSTPEKVLFVMQVTNEGVGVVSCFANVDR